MAGKGRTNKRAGKKGGKKGTRKNLGKGGSTFLPNIPNMGLAIIVMMYRNTHSVDVNFLNRLKN